MWEMFYNCSNLVTIEGIIDMKSCTDYGTIDSDGDSRMFAKCSKLKGVKIKNPPALRQEKIINLPPNDRPQEKEK